jgi:hypothetical protein
MDPTMDSWGYRVERWYESSFIGGKQHSLKGCQTNQTNAIADTIVDVDPPKEKPRPCRVHGIQIKPRNRSNTSDTGG